MNQEVINEIVNFLIHLIGWTMLVYLIENNRPKSESVLCGKNWFRNCLIYIAATIFVSIKYN